MAPRTPVSTSNDIGVIGDTDMSESARIAIFEVVTSSRPHSEERTSTGCTVSRSKSNLNHVLSFPKRNSA